MKTLTSKGKTAMKVSMENKIIKRQYGSVNLTEIYLL